MAWDCEARRDTVRLMVARGGLGVRSLEIIGTLSRATDLGTGLPDEHALSTAAIAARLATLVGANADDARRVGLRHSADCTTDAHQAALLYGEDIEMRADFARVAGRQVEVLAGCARRSSAPPSAGLPADLTPREGEVLRLLARGLTNKEIAARLEISPKTAGHHVERAYAKAGVRTRAAATLFAVEHGIAGAHR
jgi:DNA-binding CsgD family transcriptional regulator